jgi:hypothetical protein
VSLKGGPIITVTDSLIGVAGDSWGRDGFIYADGLGSASLVRVEAKGGAVPKWFTVLDTARGEVDHLWPDVLPNGKGVLFTALSVGKTSSFAIAVAEIPSGKHHVIVNDAMYARYATSGHLLYVTGKRTLMVAPFDQNSMKMTGEPTALLENVRMGNAGAADLVVSQTGTLLYVTSPEQNKEELVWVTRAGTAQAVDPDWQEDRFHNPSLSRDGKRLAITKYPVGNNPDIWIKQLDRGPAIRLTLDGRNWFATWAPDGQSVTFAGKTAGSFELLSKRADGSAQAKLQLHAEWDLFEPVWAPDGKWLVFEAVRAAKNFYDILGVRPGTDTVPVALVATKFEDTAPAISPDGRWLAYASDESGRFEIYVVPFPNTTSAKWSVSTKGGTEPVWAHSGRELFYRDGARNLVASEVNAGPTFSLGHSTILFPAGGFVADGTAQEYAVSADDRRFLMIRPMPGTVPDELITVENWFEELKTRSRR